MGYLTDAAETNGGDGRDYLGPGQDVHGVQRYLIGTAQQLPLVNKMLPDQYQGPIGRAQTWGDTAADIGAGLTSAVPAAIAAGLVGGPVGESVAGLNLASKIGRVGALAAPLARAAVEDVAFSGIQDPQNFTKAVAQNAIPFAGLGVSGLIKNRALRAAAGGAAMGIPTAVEGGSPTNIAVNTLLGGGMSLMHGPKIDKAPGAADTTTGDTTSSTIPPDDTVPNYTKYASTQFDTINPDYPGYGTVVNKVPTVPGGKIYYAGPEEAANSVDRSIQRGQRTGQRPVPPVYPGGAPLITPPPQDALSATPTDAAPTAPDLPTGVRAGPSAPEVMPGNLGVVSILRRLSEEKRLNNALNEEMPLTALTRAMYDKGYTYQGGDTPMDLVEKQIASDVPASPTEPYVDPASIPSRVSKVTPQDDYVRAIKQSFAPKGVADLVQSIGPKTPEPVDAPLPSWASDNNASFTALADKLGISSEIQQLAQQGLVAKDIAATLAQRHPNLNSAGDSLIQIVRAVRQKAGIDPVSDQVGLSIGNKSALPPGALGQSTPDVDSILAQVGNVPIAGKRLADLTPEEALTVLTRADRTGKGFPGQAGALIKQALTNIAGGKSAFSRPQGEVPPLGRLSTSPDVTIPRIQAPAEQPTPPWTDPPGSMSLPNEEGHTGQFYPDVVMNSTKGQDMMGRLEDALKQGDYPEVARLNALLSGKPHDINNPGNPLSSDVTTTGDTPRLLAQLQDALQRGDMTGANRISDIIRGKDLTDQANPNVGAMGRPSDETDTKPPLAELLRRRQGWDGDLNTGLLSGKFDNTITPTKESLENSIFQAMKGRLPRSEMERRFNLPTEDNPPGGMGWSGSNQPTTGGVLGLLKNLFMPKFMTGMGVDSGAPKFPDTTPVAAAQGLDTPTTGPTSAGNPGRSRPAAAADADLLNNLGMGNGQAAPPRSGVSPEARPAVGLAGLQSQFQPKVPDRTVPTVAAPTQEQIAANPLNKQVLDQLGGGLNPVKVGRPNSLMPSVTNAMESLRSTLLDMTGLKNKLWGSDVSQNMADALATMKLKVAAGKAAFGSNDYLKTADPALLKSITNYYNDHGDLPAEVKDQMNNQIAVSAALGKATADEHAMWVQNVWLSDDMAKMTLDRSKQAESAARYQHRSYADIGGQGSVIGSIGLDTGPLHSRMNDTQVVQRFGPLAGIDSESVAGMSDDEVKRAAELSLEAAGQNNPLRSAQISQSQQALNLAQSKYLSWIRQQPDIFQMLTARQGSPGEGWVRVNGKDGLSNGPAPWLGPLNDIAGKTIDDTQIAWIRQDAVQYVKDLQNPALKGWARLGAEMSTLFKLGGTAYNPSVFLRDYIGHVLVHTNLAGYSAVLDPAGFIASQRDFWTKDLQYQLFNRYGLHNDGANQLVDVTAPTSGALSTLINPNLQKLNSATLGEMWDKATGIGEFGAALLDTPQGQKILGNIKENPATEKFGQMYDSIAQYIATRYLKDHPQEGIEAAVRYGRHYIGDFSNLPPWVRNMSRGQYGLANPFISYPYIIAKLTADVATSRPWVLASIPLGVMAFNSFLGQDEDRANANAPASIGGQSLNLPIQNSRGENYYVPMGRIAAQDEFAQILSGNKGTLMKMALSGPIMTFFNAAVGRDVTDPDREIYNDTMTSGQKFKAGAGYVAGQLLQPPLVKDVRDLVAPPMRKYPLEPEGQATLPPEDVLARLFHAIPGGARTQNSKLMHDKHLFTQLQRQKVTPDTDMDARQSQLRALMDDMQFLATKGGQGP